MRRCEQRAVATTGRQLCSSAAISDPYQSSIHQLFDEEQRADMRRQIVSPNITVAEAVQHMASLRCTQVPAVFWPWPYCCDAWGMQVKCKHGSLVVTAEENREQLLGIFTERD